MAIYEPDLNFAPVETVKLFMEHTSTCYLYDEAGIRDSAQQLEKLFQSIPDYCNFFPIRENCNPAILCLLSSCGTGVLACCEAELRLADACGFRGERILYQPIKNDPSTAHLARELGASWLITSKNLMPEFAPETVTLQYLPDRRSLGYVLPKMMARSKTGFPKAELSKQMQHLHACGTKRFVLSLPPVCYMKHSDVFAEKASLLLALADALWKETGIPIWNCQLGEGPDFIYKRNQKGLDLTDEVNKAMSKLEAVPEERRPVFHTAMSKQLLEPHGLLLSKVLEVRTFPSDTVLVLDSTICQYLRPALKKAYRHISVLGRYEISDRKYYHVGGYLPEEFDRFGTHVLPQVVPGDICVIYDVGCGGRSMPLLYGMQPLCPEYLLTCSGEIQQISRGHTSDEVMKFLTE